MNEHPVGRPPRMQHPLRIALGAAALVLIGFALFRTVAGDLETRIFVAYAVGVVFALVAVLGQVPSSQWGQRLRPRRRPSRDLARTPSLGPLVLHAGLAVVMALAGAVGLYVGLAWLLGVSAHPTGPTSEQQKLLAELVKIALGLAAGVGAAVALVVGYRRAQVEEAGSHREDRRLFSSRYQDAADLIGHSAAAVRLAGIYAMARLADDWIEQRQQCIAVLCAYLRLPYDPRDEHTDLSEREVRLTAIRLITAHLQPSAPDSWCGYDFDFTGATFDGGDFRGAVFSGGTVSFAGITVVKGAGSLTFAGAKFADATVHFTDAKFTSGRVNFGVTEFSGGNVRFARAAFGGSIVDFTSAAFSGGAVTFAGAEFTGGVVGFTGVQYTGCAVEYANAKFAGGTVSFSGARFSSGTVSFNRVKSLGGSVTFEQSSFCGATVTFDAAAFAGSKVSFAGAKFASGAVDFRHAAFTGGKVSFVQAEFSGGAVSFAAADFSGGQVSLAQTTVSGGRIEFDGATFTGSAVHFVGARFAGGQVSFDRSSFTQGAVAFGKTHFCGSEVSFALAKFAGGIVTFRAAKLSGGVVDLSAAALAAGGKAPLGLPAVPPVQLALASWMT